MSVQGLSDNLTVQTGQWRTESTAGRNSFAAFIQSLFIQSVLQDIKKCKYTKQAHACIYSLNRADIL